VLIESMRREGFELSISRPRVLFQNEGGQRLEPIEEVVVDVDFFLSGWAGFIHAATGAMYSLMTESIHRQLYYARTER
jgi:predicted membrane GTPase involved in stress response